MLSTITSFFESHFSCEEANSEKHSVDQLHLASAALMIELCKADRNIDETETAALVEILRTRGMRPDTD